MPSLQADAYLADPAATRLDVPAILIAGDETYLLDKVVRSVLERAITVPGSEAFDVETRSAAELSEPEYETLVGTPPLMNDRRVVLLKGVPAVSAAVTVNSRAPTDPVSRSEPSATGPAHETSPEPPASSAQP